MKRSISKKGFSIVELSIVLVIISVLIGSIVVANRMYEDAKLSLAQTLTMSSPIVDNENVVLWLETTLPKSFEDSELGDESRVSVWYDLSPNKNNAVQSAPLSFPEYVSDAINGLPALYFAIDATARRYLQVNNVFNLDYTIFALLKTNSAGATGTFAYQNAGVLWADLGGNAHDSIPIAIGSGTARTFIGNVTSNPLYVNIVGTINVSDNNPNIITVTRSATTGLLSLYVNGVADGSGTGQIGDVLNGNPLLAIGANVLDGRQYTGHIGEIIIFDKVLTDDERQEVEKYLSKKWGATL